MIKLWVYSQQAFPPIAAAQILPDLQPAPMDASERTECLQGTRAETIQFITNWATGPSGTQNVLWLHGLAGAGKSTLATTMANHFRKMGCLGAFLFFDRNDTDRSNPLTVIRTLAYQVGLFHPGAGGAIADTITVSPSICTSPLRDQFQELLVDPLSREGVINDNIPIVLVLDAFDECGTAKKREILLEVLAEQSILLSPSVRILITSRLENDIHHAIQAQPHIILHELQITSEGNGEDISSYMRYRMELVRKKKKDLSLGSDWPGEARIQQLIKRASGLFVWASTAMEFINGYDPRGRLNTVLKGEATSGAQAALDALYKTALESSGLWDDDEFVEDFTAIVGLILVARRPLSTTAIDVLLCLPGGRPCKYIISYLGCVLQQPIVRVLHPSFADFLLDRSRCGRDAWFFDSPVHHQDLAMRCLDHLFKVLGGNMCDLKHLGDMTEVTLPEDVAYACDFWIDHICAIEANIQSITEHLHNFLFQHFLHWFEAMSILKRSRSTILMLDRLMNWMSVSQIMCSSAAAYSRCV
jgi:hypothetical protein